MRDSVFDAVVPTADSVAGAARHCLGAAALEAGQAGFEICVAVTVALAHVAFASATPMNTNILKNTFRELWLRAIVPTADSVAGAARDGLGAVRWKQVKPGLQSALRSQSPSHTSHLPAPHPLAPLAPVVSFGSVQ